MLKRPFRLWQRERWSAVRAAGKSHSDALLVLIALPNGLPLSRVGFSASRRIGGAVVRNRVKRLLREAVRLHMSNLKPGYDVVFIARNPIRQATFAQVDRAVERVLRRAGLLHAAGHAANRTDENTGTLPN